MKLTSPLPALALLAAITFSSLAAVPSVRFSTFVGGSGFEVPFALAVDSTGASYVAGINGSTNFPNARAFGDGANSFIQKISPNGATVSYAATIAGIHPRAIAVDAAGNAYLAGYRYDNGLPITPNAIQPTLASVWDAVILKLNAAGDTILFCTYLGGSGDDTALGIAVDPTSGDIWVSGITSSTNFPTAGQPYQAAKLGDTDAFLVRLSNDGSVLEYSTYFGSTSATIAYALAIDSIGRPTIGGVTGGGLPILNAFQSTAFQDGVDAFITKFDTTGRNLVFSTYFGGGGEESVNSIAFDSDGNLFIHGLTTSTDLPRLNAAQNSLAGGEDVFVAKFNTNATALIYSTYIGSSIDDASRGWPNLFGANDTPIFPRALAVSATGRALVTGITYGADLAVTNAIKAENQWYSPDVFAVLLEPDGAINFSTYLGGSGADFGGPAAATPDGGFVVAGLTLAGNALPNFPVTPGSAQTTQFLVGGDVYVTKLDTSAPPLGNDAFANAAMLPPMEGTFLVQNASATKEPLEQNHAGNSGGKSVWYRWTAPVAGKLILNTTGSDFTTLLALYRGTALNNLQLAASSQTEIRQPVLADESFYIAADGNNGASGNLWLSLTMSLPPNDDFADRLALTGPNVTASGSNIGATSEPNDTQPRTIWWKWTAPTSGDYTVRTLTNNFISWMWVYSGTDRANLTLLGQNQFYTNQLSRITFRAQAGQEYQIMISGDSGTTGSTEFNLAPAIRPPNDDFANRTPLTGRNPPVITGTDFDTTFDVAEWDLQRLVPGPIITGHMIWYEWTSPIDGAAEITTTNSSQYTAPGTQAGTSMIIFTGDTFPTTAAAITLVVNPNGIGSAQTYLTEVHQGVKYQIGLDAVDWQQPVQFSLKIRAIAPPKIILNTVRILTGQIQARVEGIEGKSYRVKATTNFITWDQISDHLNITGEFTFQTPVTSLPPYRFFRVEEIPTVE